MRLRLAPFVLSAAILAGCISAQPQLNVSPCTGISATSADETITACANTLAQTSIIVDGHIDVPYRMSNFAEDVSVATVGGDFDYPRARAGGLNAPFMSIYIPAERQLVPGSAARLADSLIDIVEGFELRAPRKFRVATSVAEVREDFAEGRISLPLGMENGAPIESLDDLRHFTARGIRYITLTHGKDNQLADSSYDTTYTHNGLSAFGETVVENMNDLGVIVDISHVSDSTFFDVMRLTRAPVIASHSSARHFTPGMERNMGDDLLLALKENGGVIMINFGSFFLKSEYAAAGTPVRLKINQALVQRGLEADSPEGRAVAERVRKENPVGTIDDVVEHIDYIAQMIGVEHIGLGSDYDGVMTLPAGLMDVSTYPNLIEALLRKGYSPADIRLILGENVLRVWSRVEAVAAG